MQRHWIFKRMPNGQTFRDNRYLKPFAPYLDRHFLWQFNRRSVSGGVAAGLFMGILSPVAQILLAALTAMAFRVNLPVAAFCTFVTNPFTVPPLYYLAYKLGGLILHSAPTGQAFAAADAPAETTLMAQFQNALSSGPQFIEWAMSFGLPLMLGLLIIASASAVLGYFAVHGLWHVSVRLRWIRRRTRQ